METKHPGLYFKEIAGTSPVQSVSSAIAGFVGISPKGRVGEPVLVTNWSEYVKEFGGFSNDSYLAYAVRGFFENGGSRAYIARAVHYNVSGEDYTKTSAVSTADYPTTTPALKVNAKSDGEWGNDVQFEITEGSTLDKINFRVYYKNNLVEVFNDVGMDSIEAETKDSEYVEIIALADAVPAVTDKVALTGGDDGVTGIEDSDYQYVINKFDPVQVTLMALPGITTSGAQQALLTYAESRGDIFAVLDSPLNSTVSEVKEYVVNTANLASEFGGIYYPNLKVSDPIGVGKNPTKVVPPSGHIIGAIARTDATIGVWRAPAGTDVKLRGVLGLDNDVSDTEQGILNPVNINAIRAFDGEGVCVWGTRTLSSGEYKYIPTRRLMMHIQQSLKSSMLWTTFKPNDEKLWGMIKSSVEGFLNTIWTQGGLKGQSAGEAYFVKCDSELNTQAVVDSGKTFVDIGIATNKPAEFIVFRLSLKR